MLEGLWLKTGRQVYKTLCLFWSKIFAVAFGMGVVSGIVTSYEFGTNASLYAVFPEVYSVVLSALYLPLLFMAVCLIFRGVAFEIRGKVRPTRHLWDLAFTGGSVGATFFQGVVIGSWLSGIPVSNNHRADHPRLYVAGLPGFPRQDGPRGAPLPLAEGSP